MAGTDSYPTVVTQLAPPVARAGLVERENLFSLFEPTVLPSLILVTSPAGWGKTTTTASWLAARQHRAAWLRVYPADRSPRRFWELLCAAIAVAYPDQFDESLALASVPTVDIARHLLPTLVNEVHAATCDVRLIIDSAEHIVSPAIVGELDSLLAHASPNFSLIILSRRDLDLNRGRLLLSGRLVEISRSQLAFGDREADQLLRAVAPELSPPARTDLVRATSGWAAGLIFGAYSRHRMGADELLGEYLDHEIASELPDGALALFTRTSILDEISVVVCQALEPEADVPKSFQAAATAGLIETNQTYEGAESWSVLPIVRDHLLRRLELHHTTADIGRLRIAAARIYADRGDLRTAVNLTADAGPDQPERSADLLTELWLNALNAGLFAQLETAIDALPAHLVHGSPPLTMAGAWAALNQGRLAEAEEWAARLRSSLGDSGDRYRELRGGAAMFDAHLARHLGRVDSAALAARHALAEVDTAGDNAGHAGARAALGQNLFWSGDPAAEEHLLEGLRVGNASGEHITVISCASHLGLLQAINGNRIAATMHAGKAIDVASDHGLGEHQHTAVAELALGILAAHEGDGDAAGLRLERAQSLAERGLEPYEILACHVELARLSLRSGNRSDAINRSSTIGNRLAALPAAGIVEHMLADLDREIASVDPMQTPNRALIEPLTERELAVLRLLRSDLTQREISNELFVSFNTGRTHTKAIYRKLGVNSRAAAVAAAIQLQVLG